MRYISLEQNALVYVRARENEILKVIVVCTCISQWAHHLQIYARLFSYVIILDYCCYYITLRINEDNEKKLYLYNNTCRRFQ